MPAENQDDFFKTPEIQTSRLVITSRPDFIDVHSYILCSDEHNSAISIRLRRVRNANCVMVRALRGESMTGRAVRIARTAGTFSRLELPFYS